MGVPEKVLQVIREIMKGKPFEGKRSKLVDVSALEKGVYKETAIPQWDFV